MNFRITGLNPEPFKPLYGLSDPELAAKGVFRKTAEDSGQYPDRITMQDAQKGETLLLLHYEHQPVASPYRSRHAIYVLEGAVTPFDAVNTVPNVMRHRVLSLRGFDKAGFIKDADIIVGSEVEDLIERLFAQQEIKYIQAHNAKQGCFSGHIFRA